MLARACDPAAALPAAELASGGSPPVRGRQARIAVVRIGDDVYAIGDRCDEDISLAEGGARRGQGRSSAGSTASEFSLETGQPLSLPATRPEPVWCGSRTVMRVVLVVEDE